VSRRRCSVCGLPGGPKLPRGKAQPRKYGHLSAVRMRNQIERLERISREGPRRKSRIY